MVGGKVVRMKGDREAGMEGGREAGMKGGKGSIFRACISINLCST